MRIGVICRSDQTGLGIQSKEFYDHIPCKALVIDVSKISRTKQNHDWYPGATICYIERGLKIPFPVMDEFLKDIDILITFETPYDYQIFQICHERGIKTILQLNYEFLEYPSGHLKPDLFAAPSLWHYDDIPNPKIYLTVPVNTKHFIPQRRENTFIHIGGKPAHADRNGTQSFVASLQYVKSEITAIVYSQREILFPEVPPNVKLITQFIDKKNYWDNYSGGVLVMPRKYGGLSLPVNEALANDMPVIMSDISPNNLWLPNEWLVPAKMVDSFKCKKVVEVYETDVEALAAKIDQFCNPTFYDAAIEKAKKLKDGLSWEALLPIYHQMFYTLLNNGY